MKAYTQIPPGTQNLIGRAARRRRALERAICSVFEGWSYEEIIPPIFDYYDVFAKGMGAGQEEQIYRFIDREGNIRLPSAGIHIARRKNGRDAARPSPKPIRLYYSGEVLRFDKPKGGRQREFAQIGIEHYGSTGKAADIEILLIAVETFQRLGIQGFQINLGSVDFFGGIVDRMELPEQQIAALKEVLNIKDQPGLEALLQKLTLDDRRKKILRAVPHLTGGKPVITEARNLVKNPRSVESLDHLEEIYSIFEKLDLAQHLTIDLGEFEDSTTTREFSFARTCGISDSRSPARRPCMTDCPPHSARMYRQSVSHSFWIGSNRSPHRRWKLPTRNRPSSRWIKASPRLCNCVNPARR
jgi:ATP phosphoribosyltransferase regulatory subunit